MAGWRASTILPASIVSPDKAYSTPGRPADVLDTSRVCLQEVTVLRLSSTAQKGLL